MNTIIDIITDHLWAVSWQVTILIAVIWLVDRLSFRASSLFRYWLWMIVLLRLCVPVSIELPTGIDTSSFINTVEKKVADLRYRHVPVYETGDTSPLADLPLVRDRVKTILTPDYNVTVNSPAITLQQKIFFLWYTVFVVICIYIAARTIAMIRRLKLCVPVDRPEVISMLGELSSQMGLKKPAGLYYMERDLGDIPAVIGIFRRKILIPRIIADEWPVEDLKPVLLHELAHIKRRDLLVNMFQILIQALYFFHPFVWFVNRQIWQYREEVCDDLAVRQHDNRRKHYTLSMFNVLKTAIREPSLGFVGIGFTERKSLVQKRIKRILNTNYRMTTRLSFISVFVLILLGTSGIAVSCKKSIDKAEKRESKVIKPPTMELLLSKVERPDSSIIRLQHPDNIKVNSLRVILNSDTLAYGTDYSYDFRTGKLILLAEETWSPDADISIRYDTYEPEDVNRIIFELTEEGQKLILEAPVNGTDGREGARKFYEAQKKAYKEGYINRVILIRAPSDVDIDVHRYMQKIRKSSSGIDKTNSENSEQKQAKNYPLPKKQIVVDTTKQIVVELNKEGDILIEGQKVSYESFEAYLAQEKHERFLRSQPSTVLIKADVDIPHERVIQFMRLLRKQENESKNFEFELPEEFKQDDGNFLEKQNDGNAIDNRETLEYKTKERIRIPGSNSIQVGSGESIKRGTDQVLLNGISLKRGTDYTIDYETGIVMLLNEEAMDPKADLVIKYDEEN